MITVHNNMLNKYYSVCMNETITEYQNAIKRPNNTFSIIYCSGVKILAYLCCSEAVCSIWTRLLSSS